MKDILINVDGMTCNHCKIAVENELKAITGVLEVEANLINKSVKISLEDENISLEALYNAIKEAGYQPKKKD